MAVKMSVATTHPVSAHTCVSVSLQSFPLQSFRLFLGLRGKNSLRLSELSVKKCQFPHICRTVASAYDITAALLSLCTVTALFSTLCAFQGCYISFTRPLPSSSRLQYGKSIPFVSVFLVFRRLFILCYSVCFYSL